MVLLAALSDPLSTLDIACNRTAEVTIGTVSSILVALVLAPNTENAPIQSTAPRWSSLLGSQWPSLQHPLRTGVAVMLVPLVWSWLELPNLSQTAVTAAAVMAAPAPSSITVTSITMTVHLIFQLLTGH
jgi:uncharacterized membrane protein YgaE (UPF0421/DUF939 family)